MAARKQTAVNTVASLEQQLAQLKAQLSKARAAQAADAGNGLWARGSIGVYIF